MKGREEKIKFQRKNCVASIHKKYLKNNVSKMKDIR